MRPLLTCFVMLLVLPVAPLAAQQLDVDRELEEAKGLYSEAKFAQAIAKLQATIGRLEQLRDIQARKIQLSDAHLHLALSYVALNDPSAAKESLKQMLRVDRNRKLDPDVYAPKVIELFEQARGEVAGEPKPAGSGGVPSAAASPAAAKKAGGSKTLPILLGVGAAGGAAVALAGRSGGGSGSSAASTPAASPTPAPTLAGTNDVALVSAVPPAGSTIGLSDRQASCGQQMCFDVRYSLQASSTACLELTVLAPTGCEAGKNGVVVQSGTGLSVVVPFGIATGCGLPVDLPKLRIRLGGVGPGSGVQCNATSALVEKLFDVSYRITP